MSLVVDNYGGYMIGIVVLSFMYYMMCGGDFECE